MVQESNIISFYNACIKCGNTDIRLVDDSEHKLSKGGGIRATCIKCAWNSPPEKWNYFNPIAGEDIVV